MTALVANTTPVSAQVAAAADINMRPLWSPAMYLLEKRGRSELERVCAAAKIENFDLEDKSRWLSFAQLDGFLTELGESCATEEEFVEACTYEIEAAYDPIRYALLATSPVATIATAARGFRVVSSVSRMEVLERSSNLIRLRYTSTAPREHESRWVCLSRRATTAALPTFFGLPVARCAERKCIARGDDCCEYEFRFLTKSHWLPTVGGLLLGVTAAVLLANTDLAATALWIALPLIGALIGALWEFRRTYRANLNHTEEIREALRTTAETEAEARGEILDLHQRQKEWATHLEYEVAERTATAQQVVDRLKALGERRIVNMRGFSHDLRNPLAVFMASLAYLRTEIPDTPDCHEALDDCETSVRAMERLLGELVSTVKQERGQVRLAPEHVGVAPLVDKLRRRMRALVLGRDIRVSVFKTREAPEQIHIDTLVFERVIDNLFTNAAKYTERGSIVVELDGSPGFLTLKVSDTGCGIEEADIAHIFRPEGSAPERRSSHSLGIGLSVVIRLLQQIGGRLEVMSKPAQGTTFWAHFPIQGSESAHAPRSVPLPGDDEVVHQVVTIRRAS